MKECHICKKKMPQHVFGGHMKLRHPEKPYPNGVKPGKVVRPTLKSKPEIARLEKMIKELEYQVTTLISKDESQFDYQKPQTCASCQQVHPAILMKYHSHVVHGV